MVISFLPEKNCFDLLSFLYLTVLSNFFSKMPFTLILIDFFCNQWPSVIPILYIQNYLDVFHIICLSVSWLLSLKFTKTRVTLYESNYLCSSKRHWRYVLSSALCHTVRVIRWWYILNQLLLIQAQQLATSKHCKIYRLCHTFVSNISRPILCATNKWLKIKPSHMVTVNLITHHVCPHKK